MKRKWKILSLILALTMVVSICIQPVAAATKESSYFSSYWVDLEEGDYNSFQIWFDVSSNAIIMDELGTSKIEVYRSADASTWTKVKTYYKGNYLAMTSTNTTSHVGYVTYAGGWTNYYYKAKVTLYAKNGNNIGELSVYTGTIRI